MPSLKMRTALDKSARLLGADDNRRKGSRGTLMTNKTRTHITIQTRQTIVVRLLRNSFRAWCEHCRDVVVALTPESIAEVLRIQHNTLDGVLASGKWHVVEQGAKSPL